MNQRKRDLTPEPPAPIFSYRNPGASIPPAPFLPMTKAEMDELGWDRCDII